MFISKSMTKTVITAREDMPLLEAKEIMASKSIRHIPVIDENGKLIGIVTDRDVRSAFPSILIDENDSCQLKEKIENTKIKDIMTKNPATVSPSHTIQDALLLIQKVKVGAFPVVDEEGYLKGIISVRDLLNSFINVLGIGQPGTLIGILAEEKMGQMKKIVDAITEEKISFGSILVARYWEKDKRAVFVYLLTNTVVNVKRKLENLGYTLINPMEWYLSQHPQV